MEKRIFKINGKFPLECGDYLTDIEICYHISKEYPHSNKLKKVIWITHALTANSNPMDWWDVLVGEDKFFNPREYTIICANILGSCYGSTSPLSTNPKTQKPYLLDFPQITVRDIANCHNLLLEHLKIPYVDLLIGGSVGGFQALEWSILHNDKIKNLVLLACNARFSPWGSAFNESQRMALFADETFTQQNYTKIDNAFKSSGGEKGLAAARSIALLSYRSYDGYNTTQYEDDINCTFPKRAASYQQYQGKKLVDRFNPYSYLMMLNLTDSHNIARNRISIPNALKQIKAKTICVGIDSDVLFPCSEQKFMAKHINGGIYREIHSKFGHDGFLLEWEQIKNIIEQENLI